MAKFLFVYHGGGMPESEAEGEKIMAAWMGWFASMGASVVDGGNPIGPSTTVLSDGSVVGHGGANPATGYGVFEARDLNAAIALAKGCPILMSGGSVEVGELFDPTA